MLATLPHDTDDLPLLAAEALLLGEGMHCLSLGITGTGGRHRDSGQPVGCGRCGALVRRVAESKIAMASLEALREALPAAIPVWAVGELIGRLRREPAGVT